MKPEVAMVWIDTPTGSFKHGEVEFERPGQHGDVEQNVKVDVTLVIDKDTKEDFLEELKELIAKFAL